MTQPMLTFQHVTHRYNGHAALQDFELSTAAGEVLGLLGPNGAGKTTSVRLANGLINPSSGNIRTLGLDPIAQGDQIRAKTGVLTETPALYERLTARQNLAFFGQLMGMSAEDCRQRSQELLSYFDLTERADDRAGTYSKGMKQRLALARALLHRPRLLFLDEPTSGLDPEAAAQVHELIATLRDTQDQTVLLCTHNLFEAQRLCDRLAIMNRGKLLAMGSLDELRREVMPGLWAELRFYQPPEPAAFNAVRAVSGVMQVEELDAQTWRLQAQEEAVLPQVVTALTAQAAQITALRPNQASLEDIYFKLQSAHTEGA